MKTRNDLKAGRSEKIITQHLERLAIIYVRQSTHQQVLHHQGSTQVQYGLQARAITLGWSAQRVMIIDDDLGKSGSSAEGRVGFQRLVAEVSLDHVGIIMGAEMSRLARSCKDWYQLLEICAWFGTLIGDLDGVYDPTQYNDRLLLGLKGTMSEAELHIIKQRLLQALRLKAQSGKLALPVPSGYVRRPSGEVTLDPDEQVRHVTQLIFRKYEELGTVSALLRYLVAHQVQIGYRIRGGPDKGELEWRRPNLSALQRMLKHPIYAGAYSYGRNQVNHQRRLADRPTRRSLVLHPDAWYVLRQAHYPAYITWDQYEENLVRLKSCRSRSDTHGAIRSGPALLVGLVACGRCSGRYRMGVLYSGNGNRHDYRCTLRSQQYGEAVCQLLQGPPLDAFVSDWVLRALEPAALEVAMAAAAHLEQERRQQDQLWRHRLERGAFEAERAGRQYNRVEPENRLVARQLEREWETKLQVHRQLAEEYRRFQQTQPPVLSAEEREAIRRLALDIPALWTAPTTTDADRKALIRQVIEKVYVVVMGVSEQVQVTIAWVGGGKTEDVMIRPVAQWEQLSYFTELCDVLTAQVRQGCDTESIARCLNEHGFRTPRQRAMFNRYRVQKLMQYLCVNSGQQRPLQEVLGANEWWLIDLARTLRISNTTLHAWVQRGWVRGRKRQQGRREWILWADDAELQRLRQRYLRPPRQDMQDKRVQPYDRRKEPPL